MVSPRNKFHQAVVGLHPTPRDWWSGLIRTGRFTSCYKFALARSLLDIPIETLEPTNLDVIAVPYARHICRHLKLADRQSTSRTSQFLDVCRSYNTGSISKDKLTERTIRDGFTNVIDRFHVLNGDPIDRPFFHRVPGTRREIQFTTAMSQLLTENQRSDLIYEVEIRWAEVESAWNGFEVDDHCRQHVKGLWQGQQLDMHVLGEMTLADTTLLQLQAGRCFYCHIPLISERNARDQRGVPTTVFVETDFARNGPTPNIWSAWNIVLSCDPCSILARHRTRPIELAWAQVLHLRNEHMVSNKHRLSRSIMEELGYTSDQRNRRMLEIYRRTNRA